MENRIAPIIILLLSITLTIAPTIPTIHAQPLAPFAVSVTPSAVANLSETSGPITFSIQVSNTPSLSLFGVWLQFDARVLSPLNPLSQTINYTGNILGPSAHIASECIGTTILVGDGGGCLPLSPGMVSLVLYTLGNQTSNSSDGFLYKTTFNVIGVGLAQLHIFRSVFTNGGKFESYNATENDSYFTNQACPSGSGNPCIPPIASFVVSPIQPALGIPITFNASASVDPNSGGRLMNYTWSWGEQSTCRGQDTTRIVMTPTATHTFCTIGGFLVTLKVEDNYGLEWSITRSVTISYYFIDVFIDQFSVSQQANVVVGTSVTITASVRNNSTIPENVTLTVSENNQTLSTSSFKNMRPSFESNSTLTTWNTTGQAPGTYRIEASLAPIPGANVTSGTRRDLYVQLVAVPDEPPLAEFAFSPKNPVIGENVVFDGSGSFDPDGRVQFWEWSFGDGSFSIDPLAVISHTYNLPGLYNATLTVIDSSELRNSTSMIISVQSQPQHDVNIIQTSLFPQVAVSTQNVFIDIILKNAGLSNETVKLTAYDDGRAIQTVSGVFVQACPLNFFRFCYNQTPVTMIWDTGGVSSGNHTITAVVTLPAGEVDPTPADNNVTVGIETILPPPIIIASPDNGQVGSQITIRGSGFLPTRQSEFPSQTILITFDDMFIGEAFAQHGTFVFTLDVPQSQPGLHTIKAVDQSSNARAFESFTVSASRNDTLKLTIKTGSVYFPGDTIVAYISVSLNGTTVSPSNLQLSAYLAFSNGTSRPLTIRPLNIGLYETSYAIPSNGPLGTYAIVAEAHLPGTVDASSMASFQVQLSWLSSNRNNIITVATLAGVVGLVAFSWSRGYLRKKDDH